MGCTAGERFVIGGLLGAGSVQSHDRGGSYADIHLIMYEPVHLHGGHFCACVIFTQKVLFK